MSLLRSYATLIRLYPKAYREEYGDQMLQTLADMLKDAPGSGGKVLMWTKAVAELPISVLKENVLVIEEAAMTNAPNYVKRNTHIGMYLIAPFFILIAFNALLPHSLPQGPLAIDVLRFMVIGLPAIAFVLCAGTFVAWSLGRRRKERVSFWQNLIDIRQNWPLLLVGALGFFVALFILGHDSVHCLTDNPVNALKHLQATQACISQD